MALSSAQLIMLDTLIYSDYVQEGATVGSIVDRMRADIQAKRPISGASMSNREWTDLLNAIDNNPSVLDYTVRNLETQSSGMRAACFVKNDDVNVVFRGTVTAEEWGDNGEGGYLPDSDIQQAAAEYVKNLPAEYGNNMTVSGHSKGGNLAQYVTIALAKTENDRIANCVSIDGQGFSDEFMDKYADSIAEKSASITSISAERDVVNALLYPVAGNRIYLKTAEQSELFDYHKPAILLDKNGNLREQTEQNELVKLINEYTSSLVTYMPEPTRSLLLDNAMLFTVAALNGKIDEEEIARFVGVGVGALQYMDNFIFHEIGERYGVAAEWIATVAAMITMPLIAYRYMDDLLYATGNALKEAFANLQNLADGLYRKLVAFGDRVKALADHFAKSFAKFAYGVTHWVNKQCNPGYRYADANPYIDVDTAKLRLYAQRLAAVNKRIAALDRRLDGLYKKIGASNLGALISADLLIDSSLRLKCCERYLNETASDFDKVEQDVARLF